MVMQYTAISKNVCMYRYAQEIAIVIQFTPYVYTVYPSFCPAHLMVVYELHPLEDLPDDLSDVEWFQPVGVLLHVIKDSPVHELKDQVKALLAMEDVKQTDEVLVTELLLGEGGGWQREGGMGWTGKVWERMYV